jgi:hypothetical protein
MRRRPQRSHQDRPAQNRFKKMPGPCNIFRRTIHRRISGLAYLDNAVLQTHLKPRTCFMACVFSSGTVATVQRIRQPQYSCQFHGNVTIR